MSQLSSPAPQSSPTPRAWPRVHTMDQYHDPQAQSGAQTQWRTIYTTYTAPPASGIYQPMVQATDQPMPTPLFSTPTPQPSPTAAPLPTAPAAAPTP